jgi:NAD(P) transhydrogenase subunit alpha
MSRRKQHWQNVGVDRFVMAISQSDLVVNLLIFLMATFLGTELIRHVSRLLHTPLMSLTNAISSVSFIAALIVMIAPKTDFILTLVTVAVALAATNIISGFMITERILRMFKTRKQRK